MKERALQREQQREKGRGQRERTNGRKRKGKLTHSPPPPFLSFPSSSLPSARPRVRRRRPLRHPWRGGSRHRPLLQLRRPATLPPKSLFFERKRRDLGLGPKGSDARKRRLQAFRPALRGRRARPSGAARPRLRRARGPLGGAVAKRAGELSGGGLSENGRSHEIGPRERLLLEPEALSRREEDRVGGVGKRKAVFLEMRRRVTRERMREKKVKKRAVLTYDFPSLSPSPAFPKTNPPPTQPGAPQHALGRHFPRRRGPGPRRERFKNRNRRGDSQGRRRRRQKGNLRDGARLVFGSGI